MFLQIPTSIVAAFWGVLAGSALLIGALIGFKVKLSERITAGVMAFGSGVLISVLALELMEGAVKSSGVYAAGIGFIIGALIYTGANEILAKYGARHRKRSHKDSEDDNGTAIAIGALIDGIPESMAIGLSLLSGSAVSIAVVIGIFLSNIPEGLSSAAGMKRSGKSLKYVLLLWTVITVLSGLAAYLGYAVFGQFDKRIISAVQALAAGGILAMVVDTMIPEAFSKTHKAAGLITTLGFLAAFVVSQMA